ncbi:hypothetical protein HDU96_001397 [Phlyctochytrium bullatum]|nr:hypothetical protein HDU96_001397 [Phlyctochytrium bullatum]
MIVMFAATNTSCSHIVPAGLTAAVTFITASSSQLLRNTNRRLFGFTSASKLPHNSTTNTTILGSRPLRLLLFTQQPQQRTVVSATDPFGLPRPATAATPYLAMTASNGTTQRKQTKIMLRVPTQHDFHLLESLLARREKGAGYRCVINVDRFYDGPDSPLWRTRHALLRVRRSCWRPDRHSVPDLRDGPTPDDAWVVTLKTESGVRDGVYEAVEEDVAVDAELGEAIVEKPGDVNLWRRNSALSAMVDHYGLGSGLRLVGELASVRTRFSFDGGFVSMDEIAYPFGTEWGAEIESVDLKHAESLIMGILKTEGIPYEKRTRSRFENLLAGSMA